MSKTNMVRPDAGHHLLQALVDSIVVNDGVACWDFMRMYDVRDALLAAEAIDPVAWVVGSERMPVIVRCDSAWAAGLRFQTALYAASPPPRTEPSPVAQRELLDLIENYANAKVDMAQNPTHASAREFYRLVQGNLREAVSFAAQPSQIREAQIATALKLGAAQPEAPSLRDLATHLRGECQDAVDFGDGRLNTTRVLEIVDMYDSSPCNFCGKNVSVEPPCESAEQAEGCDAGQPEAVNPKMTRDELMAAAESIGASLDRVSKARAALASIDGTVNRG